MRRAKLSTSVMEEESEQLDLSLLRRPVIATSVTGFEEALRAYQDGTNEMKKLLAKECDLIYECKVCRNIFRSLTNFISHKRVYCRNSFSPTDHFHFRNARFSAQDVSTIIETEQKISNNPNGTAGVLPGSGEKNKDLSAVVENILWKQHQSRNSSINDVYDEIQSLQTDKGNVAENSEALLLNPINDSGVAVYQSLQKQNEISSIKDEINEVHNIELKSNTVLGPDGKVIKLFATNGESMQAEENVVASFSCKFCNLACATEKMLKLHLKLKHLPSAFFYQCPSCSQRFSSSAAVLKHLSSDHKKSNRRIRLMRDNIIKKRVRADEVSTKHTSNMSRELLQLQDYSNSENSLDVKKENDPNDDANTCPSCLKKFDRKAVYISHVQMCSDIKDREQEKLKKRQAKDGAKMKQISSNNSMESEESSNVSEQKSQSKLKRCSKNKFGIETNSIGTVEENSEDIIDWNLDDEDEKRKLDNIKKEIIEDEYIKNMASSVSSGELKCPTCEKLFETTEKLKYHLTFYHSRQKRFKCKMCEYQGYRKKDTMNHINFVHNANVTLETLGNYTETVSKAVNEEDVKIQNELKKNQLKIKRKMARERKRKKKIEEARLQDLKSQNDGNDGVQIKIEKCEKFKEASNCENYSPSLKPKEIKLETMVDEQKSEPENEIKKPSKSDESSASRESSMHSYKLPEFSNISRYNFDGKDTSPSSRPIRNRIKPVRKDFLYDLSDLLKKEADAHREQNFQSTNVTVKRELRKRAMSTHVRPTISTFDHPSTPTKKLSIESLTQHVLRSPGESLKDQKNRRMSVFIPPTRSMFPPQPRSPPYRPPATHKNAGSAYKMALKEHDCNRVSMYEPKFLWTICFEHETERIQPTYTTVSGVSAASSILQRLSGKNHSSDTKMMLTNEKTNSLTAEQLCKKFELINVTHMNDLDIAVSNTINLNPGSAENNLLSLNLGESSNSEICVLQECDSENDDHDDDSKPKLKKKENLEKKSLIKKRSKRSSSKRHSEKRKSAADGQQRRLTVMQRLQENKIRKSREQLFQRLVKQSDDVEDDLHDLES